MPPRTSPLAVLLRPYDTGEVLAFRPLTEGRLNRAYQVRTESGTYFLKHYLDPDHEAIAFQHRASTALAGAGLPAAPPLATKDGRTVVRHNHRSFALYPWLPGEHRQGHEFDHGECVVLGDLLGRLHLALDRLLPPVQQLVFLPVVGAREAIGTAEQLLDLVRHRTPPDRLDELAAFRLTERIAMLRDHARHRPSPCRRLTVGYVHGDFHALNVLHERGRPVGILDWDRLGVQPQAEELVRAAILFFVGPYDGSLDLDRIRAFTAGYTARRPEVAAELPLAVHRLWWERLTDFWLLQWRYERGDERCDDLYPQWAELVVWWTDAYEKVLTAFTG